MTIRQTSELRRGQPVEVGANSPNPSQPEPPVRISGADRPSGVFCHFNEQTNKQTYKQRQGKSKLTNQSGCCSHFCLHGCSPSCAAQQVPMRVPTRSLARRLQDDGTRLSPKWGFPWERVPRVAFPVHPIRETAEQVPEAGTLPAPLPDSCLLWGGGGGALPVCTLCVIDGEELSPHSRCVYLLFPTPLP